jgi:hypothetical protein
MPDIAYTIVWAPEAVTELRKLSDDDILTVLNNITSLARTPYQPIAGDAVFLCKPRSPS